MWAQGCGIGPSRGRAALIYLASRRPLPRLPEGGRNSVVECLLPKQKVGGSNPPARSKPEG
jgi:hypothetical protein